MKKKKIKKISRRNIPKFQVFDIHLENERNERDDWRHVLLRKEFPPAMLNGNVKGQQIILAAHIFASASLTPVNWEPLSVLRKS